MDGAASMFEPLQSKAQKILRTEYGVKNVTVEWERPAQADFGDLATPVAMQLAKELKKNPKVIAETLAEKLAKDSSVEKAEVAGPGYVNVWLKPQALIDELKKTREACTARVTRKEEAPVIVEYSSPNIAKPLGIHHILTTVIGQVIANLYIHQGYNVKTVNHIGDWGTQFGKLYVAWKHWGKGDLGTKTVDELLALYVKFHDEEENPVLEAEARNAFRSLEEGDADIRSFWKTVVNISMNEIYVLYERLHVHLAYEHGESMYENKMQPIVEEGKKKKVFTPGKDGALIADLENENLPPAIVIKGDGGTIYLTRDLATVRYRIDEWHPQASLYVVGQEQQLHFQQLFAIVKRLGWQLPHLEHVLFGRMRFADGNMSTRKGKILKLEHVLDEAVERARAVVKGHGEKIQTDDVETLAEMMGIGAVVYGILSQNRKMDILFDWDKALSFEGNSAPYLQYTHARAKSVLRKAEVKGDSFLPNNISSLSDVERSLIGGLLQFPEVVSEARESHMPHVLATYLYQLCQIFNSFYNNEPIIQAEESQKTLRLALTALTATVLKCGAELLTLRVPDRM
ncbi:arginine--tRNA ligase [Candidatus Peribacteria bacterium RIFCSPLOWO2_01_FULL_53_10]|nr:MAG: arginine--tRNA ligase [Candidatus Peribacteria bacterium RIFCSPLOWO2_01_FULL_53_10]